MFLKSRLLVAAAIVLGTASVAAAQVDAEQMMSYERTGPVLSSSGSNYDGRFDEEQMLSYGPKGYTAFAQAPEPAHILLPNGRNPNNPFDQELMESYGTNGAPR